MAKAASTGPKPADFKKQLKDLLEDQGDYNNLLKDSIRSLQRMDDYYTKIEVRLETLNKGSINIKEANRELVKSQQRQIIEQKKYDELVLNASNKAKDILNYAKQTIDVKKAAALAQNKSFDEEKELLKILKRKGDMEAVQIAAFEYKNKVAAKQVEQSAEILKNEKLVSKQIGISGNLMKTLADKLGLGEDAYEAMTLKARKLVDENGKLTNIGKWKVAAEGVKSIFASAWDAKGDPAVWATLLVKAGKTAANAVSKSISGIANGAKSALNSMTDVNVVQKMTSGVSDLLKSIPMVGGLLGGAVDLMASFLDLVIGASSKVQKMGRELGLSAVEAGKLRDSFNTFSSNTNDALVNSDKLLQTQIELGNQLGVMNVLSNERLETDIRLKEIAGLDLETRSSLVETSVILGKNQKAIVSSVFAQVNGLKQATGLQLNQKAILKEASSLGGYLGLSFAKYPEKLTKSLVTVKAMGLELKQLDSIADSFLDFESSISSQFEAQLLTGKDINLNKARELFLTNDLAGAAGEIATQVGSSADFMKMNRIQAESLAKAFGMSRDQLGDMLKKQEYMSKIGAKDTDNVQKQYQLALARYGTQKEMNAALGEENATNLMNASAQEKIAGLMDKIKQGFVDLISKSGVTEFIDKAINWISNPNNIKKIIDQIQGFFATVLDVTGTVIGGIMRFLNHIPFANINIDPAMIEMVEGAGKNFRSTRIGSSFSLPQTVGDKKATAAATVPTPVNDVAMNQKNSQPIVNLVVDTKIDALKGTSLYRVISVDYGSKSDWQTGRMG